MNKLSIESINAKTPYQVKFKQETSSYLFTSENIDYAVDFTSDDLVQTDKAYQFVIANLNNKKSPRDKFVTETVIAIIEEFFKKNNSTILILYSTDDNKQSMLYYSNKILANLSEDIFAVISIMK